MARSKYSKDLYKSFLQASSVRYSGKALSEFNNQVPKYKHAIIKRIFEILQILCAKIKEWYDIDVPEYTKDDHKILLQKL
ncbi:MAG: hypothetical protein O7C60_04855 [Rickettsia endosymbiont of Ixodes persulcatus]|nr:hypothetical protein [Rickettsia endosymbiont of Ixodes persulcatus]